MKININRICLAAMMLCHLAEATSAEVPPIEREHLADFLFDLQAHWKFEDSSTVELLDFTVLDNLVVLRSEVFEHSGEHLGLVCVRARFNKFGKLSEPSRVYLESDFVVAAKHEEEFFILDSGSTGVVIERMNPSSDKDVLALNIGGAATVHYTNIDRLDLIRFSTTQAECHGLFETAMPETEEQRIAREKQRRLDHYRMILEAEVLRDSD
ncbi:MAG: hypothetical protein ACK4M6_01020 [Hyphomonas sp.]